MRGVRLRRIMEYYLLAYNINHRNARCCTQSPPGAIITIIIIMIIIRKPTWQRFIVAHPSLRFRMPRILFRPVTLISLLLYGLHPFQKRHLQIARDNIITLECSTLYPCVYVQGVPPEFTQSRINCVSRDSEIMFFVLWASLSKGNFFENSLVNLRLISKKKKKLTSYLI